MKLIKLFFILILFACQSNVDNQKYTKETHHQSGHDDHKHSHGADLPPHIVENTKPDLEGVQKKTTEDYDSKFLKRLMSKTENNKVLVEAGNLILNNTDTIPFPDDPPLHQELEFAAQNNGRQVKAFVKRINFTSIYYKIKIKESNGNTCEHEGNANLSPYFFMGSESDVNAVTGEAYFSTEYTNSSGDCRYLSVRIGKPEPEQSVPYLVKLIVNCPENCAPLSLDDGLVLVEQ